MTTVYTIGHGTRPLQEFMDILKGFGIAHLVDVRTVPRSRHNPQFNQDALPDSLQAHGIAYSHMPGLGGLRHARKTDDSPNMGWRNDSFRGFADYMQTPEFAAALDELLALVQRETVVIMCAETVPWRCHRGLIGDALLVRGMQVEDIMGVGSARPHKLTAWAHVEGTAITYPPPAEGSSVEQQALPGIG